MGEIQEALQATLDDLIQADGILGSALISRDGIPVCSAFTSKLEDMPFSILVEGAMTATLMGAAEVAMEEVEAGRTERVVVETDRVRMVLVGAEGDLLLVTLTGADEPIDKALDRIRRSVDLVGEIMEE